MKYISGVIFSLFIGANAFASTDIDITEAWARPTGQTKNTAVYMKITNKGKDDFLTEASTDVAQSAELHQTTMVNDVAQMVKIGKLTIPAANTVSLAPGGAHVMIMNSSKELKEGDAFDLKLKFQVGGERVVKVSVKDVK